MKLDDNIFLGQKTICSILCMNVTDDLYNTEVYVYKTEVYVYNFQRSTLKTCGPIFGGYDHKKRNL